MFSLIVSTIGRKEELERLLESLKEQTYKIFEVIIIDQNEDSKVDCIVSYYKSYFEIQHVKVSKRGASKARNTGIPLAKYDLISFPDDDCWYKKNVLHRVNYYFSSDGNLDILTCKSTDFEGGMSHTKFKDKASNITRLNSIQCGIEFTIFCRKKVFEKAKGFDENIGPGSNFGLGSGEAHDFLLRAIGYQFNSFYTPEIVIFHDAFLTKKMEQNSESLTKLYSYAKGFGYVLKKNKLPFWYSFKYLIRPVVALIFAVLKMNPFECKYYYLLFKGRLNGLFSDLSN